MNVLSPVLAAVLLLVASTPNVFGQVSAETPPRPGSGHPASISFEDAIKSVGNVFPVRLNRFDQVVQNSFNWSGPNDASLYCEIGFAPQAIVIQGRVMDDQPLVQPYASPYMPPWWEIQYAADGVEISLDDPTSATNNIHFLLNFGSAGTAPRIQILHAPLMPDGGFDSDAELRLLETSVSDHSTSGTGGHGFAFRTAIPTAGLAEPRFFSDPVRIRVCLHDLDGDYHTYCRLEEVLEKKQ